MNAPVLPHLLRQVDTAASPAHRVPDGGSVAGLPGASVQAGVSEVWRHRFGTMRIEVIDGVCHVDGCAVVPAARPSGQAGQPVQAHRVDGEMPTIAPPPPRSPC